MNKTRSEHFRDSLCSLYTAEFNLRIKVILNEAGVAGLLGVFQCLTV